MEAGDTIPCLGWRRTNGANQVASCCVVPLLREESVGAIVCSWLRYRLVGLWHLTRCIADELGYTWRARFRNTDLNFSFHDFLVNQTKTITSSPVAVSNRYCWSES